MGTKNRRGRPAWPLLLSWAMALSGLAACSEDAPTATDELPPIVGSDGSLRVVENLPDDFPAEAFRVDAELEPRIPPSGSPVLRDLNTDSLIDLHGRAFTGPLADSRLQLPSLSTFSAFWFAWSVFYPGSEIWGRTETVREAVVEGDENCAVPCAQIRRVLPPDAIASLPNIGPPRGAPVFTSPGTEESAYLRETDLVIGLWDGTEARAYPHNLLWWHEIVNETFGGERLSVSLCPLTGSALVFSAAMSAHGVSGNLYNSNLVLYDHSTNSLFSQLRRDAVSGARRGEGLGQIPFVETTWQRWRQMHPDTKVLSSRTGTRQDYTRYPYGDYRSDHDDTFAITSPTPDDLFPGKWAVTGVVAGETRRAYVHEEVSRQMGETAVFGDQVEDLPVWVVFDRRTRFLQLFHAGDPEFALDLEWAVAP